MNEQTTPTFDPWKDLDTDARAEAFMAIWHDASPDEGTMLSWFANAIEVTRSTEAADTLRSLLKEWANQWEAFGDSPMSSTRPGLLEDTRKALEAKR